MKSDGAPKMIIYSLSLCEFPKAKRVRQDAQQEIRSPGKAGQKDIEIQGVPKYSHANWERGCVNVSKFNYSDLQGNPRAA